MAANARDPRPEAAAGARFRPGGARSRTRVSGAHATAFQSSLALFALLAAALPATASAAPVPEGAEWSQATFPSSDGVTLHADVLRPKGLAPTDKTPVILSIGPYFNHSGQTGPAGPVEDTSYDPVGPSRGRPTASTTSSRARS